MEQVKRFLIRYGTAFLAGAVLAFILTFRSCCPEQVFTTATIVDTVTVRDTFTVVRQSPPIEIHGRPVLRTIRDTVYRIALGSDTLDVPELELSLDTIHALDTFKLYARFPYGPIGLSLFPGPDTIPVVHEVKTITRDTYIPVDKTQWSVGINASVSIDPRLQIQPTVGVGVQFNMWEF